MSSRPLDPAAIDRTMQQAIQAHRTGRLAEAEQLYRRVLQARPGHPDANHNLGVLAVSAGRADQALPWLKAALQAQPAQGQYWVSYIDALIKAGDRAQARAVLQQGQQHGLQGGIVDQWARQLADDDDPALHFNQAVTLLNQGRLAEAEAPCRRVLALIPGHAPSHSNLGVILMGLGQLAEAQASFEQAIALAPGQAQAQNNLAVVLLEQGQWAAAEARCRQAIALRPDYAEAHNNLGVTLIELGRFAQAADSCRQAITLQPDYVEAHSNLVFSLNYRTDLPVAAAVAEARAYGQGVSRRAQPRPTSWADLPSGARLRVGFVSGDLREHPVGYFLQSLLAQLDRSRFETCVYATQDRADEQTARLRPHVDRWQSLAGLDDRTAAGRIHADGVHVLVDLAGHTAHNRLPVFAHRPAPVQVSWLGYFATTGLPEMDWVIGDPQVTPPEEASHFVERIWRLPETYFCFSPPPWDLPVGELPARARGAVTFGCFSNRAKITDAVLALWARVLQALPGSTLLLKNKQLADPAVGQDLLQRLSALGIAADRVQLQGPSSRRDYLLAWQQVDIALDTFPFPAGTTSVEALWMGVPTLTRKGDRFIGHNGETIAVNAGQAHWIATDDEDYLRKAQAFAGDLDALAATRAALRAQVLASPLFDAPRFARHFEAALHGLWAARAATPPSA